jgi:oligosaccharide repeat unit polymerase
MLLTFTFLFALFVIAQLVRRKEFLLPLMMALVLAYELPGPFIHSFSDLEAFSVAQFLFAEYASDENVSLLVSAVLVFLISMRVGYAIPRGLPRTLPASRDAESSIFQYSLLVVAVLAFGIGSVATDAGAIRFADYSGTERNTIPAFGYGTMLLVTIAPLLLAAATKRKWILVIVLMAAMLPIAHEAFISSKRQYFAPFVAVFIFYVVYSNRIRHRSLALMLVLSALLSFFAAQFLLRESVSGVEVDGDPTLAIIIPQLGEFVAVGSTSLYAMTFVQPETTTYGMNFLLTLLNSVPYIKFGDLLFPGEVSRLTYFAQVLAPFGGLSALAEAWWSFRFVGVVFFGALIGLILRLGERRLRDALGSGLSLNMRDIYWTCLIATLFVKYRSGLTDALQTAIYFSILYWLLVFPLALAVTGNSSRHLRHPS